MEAMRSTWTDSRLDDFAAETGRRFDGLESRFERVEERVDAGFREVPAELGSLQRTIIYCFVSLSTATLAGSVAIAIQL